MSGITDRIKVMQQRLMATDINGCITGSSLTGHDFDSWSVTPDIDVFCYSPYAMVHAIDVCEYQLGLEPGGDEDSTAQGERWKAAKMRTNGIGKGRDLATCKYTDGEVTVNVSHRRYQRSAMDVIARFDMSIDMIAADIPSGTTLDMRLCSMKDDVARFISESLPDLEPDAMVAVPNPFREFDGTTWNAAKWLRQWDRVIKYWDRGFDTRPMALFYRGMLKEIIDGGCLFKTEASRRAYEEFVAEFSDLDERIKTWLQDKL